MKIGAARTKIQINIETDIEESNSDSEEEIQFLDLGKCKIVDEIDFRELEQMLEEFISEEEIEFEDKLERFMSEEEIEFQDIDRCEKVELLDKQDIEECADREKCATRSLEIPVGMACEQEECIEEETCDRTLPKLPKMYMSQAQNLG